MATCRKCGGPIEWSYEDGKRGKVWVPRKVGGGDHWDDCREWRIKGTYGIQDKDRGPDHIGPVITPGHDTEKHLRKIGLNPYCCCIPFDGPYIVYPVVDFL